MSRTLTQLSFSQDELASEWEEAYNKTYENSNNSKTHSQFSNSNYNAIFSDDEDETPSPPPLWIQQQQQQQDLLLSQNLLPTMLAPPSSGYLDPVLSSSTYHIHQADNALTTLKQIALEDGWKKALKHKSGVVVHMKNGIHKGDKTPVFKGEAIIQGFSPQSIFYVIGMRKLWDEQ
jgi:hypothetical protein